MRPVGRTYHSDYATRVRALTSEIRESCLNPTDLDILAAFISKNSPEDKLAACMTEFCIRSAANREKDKFSRALAAQFSLFVASQDDDVDNAVWEIYQKLLAGQLISADDISRPRYAGDDVYAEFGDNRHEADCYEIIHHEWKLQNHGRVP